MRIRPVSTLRTSAVRVSGAAVLNGGFAVIPAQGDLVHAAFELQGSGATDTPAQTYSADGDLSLPVADFTGTANAQVVVQGDGALVLPQIITWTNPEYFVYPILQGGIFDGYESTITNQNATWRVVSEETLGGTFSYYNGGGWEFIRGPMPYEGTAFFVYEVLNYDGLGSSSQATLNVAFEGSPQLTVYPVTPGGLFEGTEGVITNINATWVVTSENTLDGSFEYFDGGGWRYTRGTQTGTASFNYTVVDYDGLGNNTSATHTVTVS